MRIVLQAIFGSIIIHVLYFTGTLLTGYIQTKLYEPDFTGAWGRVDTLQNEVGFGMVISPSFFLLTFLGGTVICGILLFFYKKFRS